jgi:glycosyltransferase involved in cell wall biosynthesis
LSASNPTLTIVIPAYNEEGSLRVVVEDATRVAQACLSDYEIVIVDDASRDGTPAVAAEVATALPRVRVVRHTHNQGSGGAIMTGVREARCELVMYVPADGQFTIEEIGDFVRAMAGHDIVIGARLRRTDYSWFRLLSSKVFITLVNFLFEHDLRDVNWVHMWRRRIFDVVHPRSRGVFMLEEILVRAQRAGFTIAQIDSRYIPRMAGEAKGSHPRTILRTIVDMMRFWAELRRGRRA